MSSAPTVSSPRKSFGKWLAILGLVALFILLRWNSFNAPLIRDEGEYAYAGQILIHGVAPYQHAFIQKPPMVIYSYALAQLLVPNLFWAPRILAFLFIALATVLAGLIARLEFGGSSASSTMWLMTPMILFPRIEQFPANTEMFMLLPLLGTIAIYCRCRQSRNRLRHWFWAGFLAVTTLLYKYTAAPILIFLFVVWFVETCWSASGIKPLLASVGAIVAGSAAAIFFELGYFLFHDGGKSFWECTLSFNRYYTASSNFAFGLFIANLKWLWESWWILFLLPIAAVFSGNRRIWFWFAMLTASVFCTGMGAYKQYYLILMPFLALLAASGIDTLAVRIKKLFAPDARFLPQLITIVVMLVILQPDLPWLICSPLRFAEAKMDTTPFFESQLVGDKIRQLTSADDFVFVAGSEPQILYYSQRYSPTRFITVYPLMIPTPVAAHYQQEAIGELKRNPPKLIVYARSPASWLTQPGTPADFWNFLSHLLNQNYHFVGCYLKDGKIGRWDQSLAEKDFPEASLLVYEKNN